MTQPAEAALVNGRHRTEQAGLGGEQRIGDCHVRGERHRSVLVFGVIARPKLECKATIDAHDFLLGHLDAIGAACLLADLEPPRKFGKCLGQVRKSHGRIGEFRSVSDRRPFDAIESNPAIG